MKNIEIVKSLQGIENVISFETENKTSILNVKGEFALYKNRKALLDIYSSYELVLDSIKSQVENNNIDKETFNSKLDELLNTDNDIKISTITPDSFLEGTRAVDLIALDFMIKED